MEEEEEEIYFYSPAPVQLRQDSIEYLSWKRVRAASSWSAPLLQFAFKEEVAR